MTGNIEIGLFNSMQYMTLEYLGKGSVIGENGLLINNEYVFSAHCRSPRVKLIRIRIETLTLLMKGCPELKNDM